MDYSNYSVLIVDDIPMNITLIDVFLRPYQLKIYKASNAQEVFDVLSQHKIDIVILDLVFPTRDEGYDVLSKIRSGASTKDIRVIGYSALNTVEDVEAGLKAGLDRYLTKPVRQKNLYKILDEQLAAIGAVSAE